MNTKTFVANILKTVTIIAGIALSLQIANADTGQTQTSKGSTLTLTASSQISSLSNDSVFVSPNPIISATVHTNPTVAEPFHAPEPNPAMVFVVALAGMVLIVRRKENAANAAFPYHMLKEYHSEFLD